jgi:L-alanine-DL-glutamate epimerase-like enolase superfamily enzyme
MSLKLAIKNVSFYIRDLKTRLPFRFGAFTLQEVPLLHLAVEAEAENGGLARGFAADNLVPKWFDKNPVKTPWNNISDLLASVHIAQKTYLQATRKPHPFWSIWMEAYPECLRQGAALKLNPLVASFGSSLFERALTDAAGRMAGLDLVSMLRRNVLELRPAEIHREVEDGDLQEWANHPPPSTLMIRHTVGLLDAITSAGLPEDGNPDDGLPTTLEENISRYGLRFFKVKVRGNVDADLERLNHIAETLGRLIPEPYVVTLDGNEQYESIDHFGQLMGAMKRAPQLQRFLDSLLFVEQPLDRAVALDSSFTEGLGEISRICPVIIDESDDNLGAFKRAIEVGYRGVSSKNCKGIIKSFLNRTLIERWNRGLPEKQRLFMSAEDLTNVPVVPLQQDLTTVRAIGLTHLERNGYHYVRGLDHCSAREREAATCLHGDLYVGDEREAFIRIANGQLHVKSLQVPGYGVAFDPDLPSMKPLDEWIREHKLDAGA